MVESGCIHVNLSFHIEIKGLVKGTEFVNRGPAGDIIQAHHGLTNTRLCRSVPERAQPATPPRMISTPCSMNMKG